MTYCANFRLGLLSATVLTGDLLAAQAYAQDEPSATYDEDEKVIIVTGTRRSTTLMDTPINISAIGGDTLEAQRIDDVRDLADFTPGMTVSDTGPGTSGTV